MRAGFLAGDVLRKTAGTPGHFAAARAVFGASAPSRWRRPFDATGSTAVCSPTTAN